MSYLLFLTIAALAALWVRWRIQHRRMLTAARTIPGPAPWPCIGDAWKFMCQPEEFIRVIKDLMETYGDVVRFWLGPDLNVVVSNPEDLKILLSNTKTSVKGPQYKYMADVLGGGILSGSGPTWRKHRKIATPNYGKRAIEGYSQVFDEEADMLLQAFRSQGPAQFDIYQHVVRATSYSVCRTLMGLTRSQTVNLPHIQDIIDDTPKLYDIVFDRMTKWYLQIEPIFWLSKHYTDQKKFVRQLSEFSKTVIKHRIERLKTLEEQYKLDLMESEEDNSINSNLSVIDRFILSQELNPEELIKETFTIFTSSQEASAKITSFLLLMMAYHPHYQEKLYAEILSVMGTDDRPVTDEDLRRMSFLEMVFKEVLRLFPIGALIQRTISENIAISTAVLPAGSSLVVPIYHLHRDKRFWNDPESFNPERFNTEQTRKRHPYSYIPFSLGPMDCLGRHFGTKLIKTLTVRVLREFQVTAKESYKDLKVAIAISVVSVHGFHAKLTPRKLLP